jgi:predicted membrane-bound dolichyl-phosphate-mannose-protein mannosyltransferase
VQKILKWAKENLILIIVVFLYSLLAFFHLGDFEAPQTFHAMNFSETFYIKLPEETKVSSMMIYNGISYGDVSMNISYMKPSDGCKSCIEHLMLSDENFSDPRQIKLEGSFKWIKINVENITSVVRINTDLSAQELSLGEIAFFDSKNNLIENIKIGDSEWDLNNENRYPELTDEQSIVPKDPSLMNSSIFDEVYFAETAYEYAHGIRGYETVHPPLGKIIQAIPIFITGKMVPFTWRFMGTLTGIFIVIAMYYLAREIFYDDKNKKEYANITVVLAAVSSLAFVQTRLGTVDSYLCFFTILSFLFMIRFTRTKTFAPLLLSGLFFGCAFATKWSGAFIGIALAIIYLSKNRFKNIPKWLGLGTLCFVIVPAIIYFGVYLLFPNTTEAYDIADVVNQGRDLYTYHSNEDTPHPYQSAWYTWPISLRPFLYAYDSDGSTITLTGNYVICYISIIALLVSLYYAIRKRDKESIYITLAYCSLFLPYAFISRPMFLYHYLPASCIAILSITNLLELFRQKRK